MNQLEEHQDNNQVLITIGAKCLGKKIGGEKGKKRKEIRKGGGGKTVIYDVHYVFFR